jgi:hypothetical protein
MIAVSIYTGEMDVQMRGLTKDQIKELGETPQEERVEHALSVGVPMEEEAECDDMLILTDVWIEGDEEDFQEDIRNILDGMTDLEDEEGDE